MSRWIRLALAIALAAWTAPAAANRVQGQASRGVALSTLFPHSLGDRWLFGDRAQEPTSSLMVAELADQGFLLESEDGRTRLLTVDAERGLLLLQSTDLDATVHSFDPPLSLLPTQLEPGQVHTAESRIVERVQGDEVRAGTRSVRAAIGEPVTVATPAGRWQAVPVSTETSTSWAGEDPTVTSEQTWYAAGVGPVRRSAPEGGVRREELLLEAKVGERLIPP